MQQGTTAVPQPVHQTVHLHVNPRRRTWQGYVQLLAVAGCSQLAGADIHRDATAVDAHC
jgi:hypothetical protein